MCHPLRGNIVGYTSHDMGRLKTFVWNQGRMLFALAVIGVCFAVDNAVRSGWPDVSGWRGSAVSSEERSAPKTDDEPGPPRKEPSRQALTPDYILPVKQHGAIPVVSRIPTDKPVVFLTLDDGLARTKDAKRLLDKHHIKAPMFLNDEYVREDPAYFRRLVQGGMTVGSHTVDHADLTTLEYDQQVAEICTNADNLEQWLGNRPTLFRPPYGSYDGNTLLAAEACGMRALVMWSAKANGGSMQYQDGHTGLVPGDIVLMHFRPEFAKDFQAFIDAAKAAGLQPESLEAWLQPAAPTSEPEQP